MRKSEFQEKNLVGLCPYVIFQELTSRKWIVLILRELGEGTKRFNQLQRKLEISHSTLTKQLRFLEYEGLVIRKIYPEVPPRVEYSLTELGESFQSVLASVEAWGKNFIKYINQREIPKGAR